MVHYYEHPTMNRTDSCPSPQPSTRSRNSTYSTFSLHSIKSRVSQFLDRDDAPTSPTASIFSPSRLKRKNRFSAESSYSTALSIFSSRRKRSNNKSSFNETCKTLFQPFKRTVAEKKAATIPRRQRAVFSTKHKRPSTLDFRCIGADDNSMMMMDGLKRISSFGADHIWGGVQKRHCGDISYLLNDAPPEVAWRRPSTSMHWDEDYQFYI